MLNIEGKPAYSVKNTFTLFQRTGRTELPSAARASVEIRQAVFDKRTLQVHMVVNGLKDFPIELSPYLRSTPSILEYKKLWFFWLNGEGILVSPKYEEVAMASQLRRMFKKDSISMLNLDTARKRIENITVTDEGMPETYDIPSTKLSPLQHLQLLSRGNGYPFKDLHISISIIPTIITNVYGHLQFKDGKGGIERIQIPLCHNFSGYMPYPFSTVDFPLFKFSSPKYLLDFVAEVNLGHRG